MEGGIKRITNHESRITNGKGEGERGRITNQDSRVGMRNKKKFLKVGNNDTIAYADI